MDIPDINRGLENLPGNSDQVQRYARVKQPIDSSSSPHPRGGLHSIVQGPISGVRLTKGSRVSNLTPRRSRFVGCGFMKTRINDPDARCHYPPAWRDADKEGNGDTERGTGREVSKYPRVSTRKSWVG